MPRKEILEKAQTFSKSLHRPEPAWKAYVSKTYLICYTPAINKRSKYCDNVSLIPFPILRHTKRYRIHMPLFSLPLLYFPLKAVQSFISKNSISIFKIIIILRRDLHKIYLFPDPLPINYRCSLILTQKHKSKSLKYNIYIYV